MRNASKAMITLLIVATLQNYGIALDTSRMRGSIKSIIVTSFETVLNEEKYYWKEYYHFDENGLLQKYVYDNKSTTTTALYSREYWIDKLKTETIKYSDGGERVVQYTYLENGEMFQKASYSKQDDEIWQTEVTEYYPGTVKAKKEIAYDEGGVIKSIMEYWYSERAILSVYRYGKTIVVNETLYDAYGNILFNSHIIDAVAKYTGYTYVNINEVLITSYDEKMQQIGLSKVVYERDEEGNIVKEMSYALNEKNEYENEYIYTYEIEYY